MKLGRWLVCAMVVATAAGAVEDADTAVAGGEVEVGSIDNRIEFALVNPSETLEAEKPFIELLEQPSWMSVTSIETEEGPLPPGAERRFTVVFDVGEQAEPGTSGVLGATFGADAAFYDEPPVRVLLDVVAGPDEEAECVVEHEHALPGWSGAEKHFVYIFRHHQSGDILRVLVLSGPAEGTFELALQSSLDEKFGPYFAFAEAQNA